MSSPRTPEGWAPQDPHALSQSAPWLAYVLPYAVFVLLTALEHLLNTKEAVYVYPLFYTLKIAAVIWIARLVWTRLPELAQKPQGVGLGIGAGLVLAILWVLLDKVTPHFSFLGHRVGYDPRTLHPAALEWGFVAVRLFGLAVIVPIIEETLFRGFLLRYVSDPERWSTVPLGVFTLSALGFVVAGMALSHPEWLAAAVFSLSMCLLIHRTRNLWTCIVAHGVTNLALGIYVLLSHDWKYW